MIQRRCRSLVVLAAVLAAACNDVTTTAPLRTAAPYASAHGSAEAGNPYFRFLSPLGNAGGATGTFDATLSPIVTIVQNGATLSQFTTAGSGPERVRLDAANEQYIVNWKPQTTGSHRIRVSVGSTLLGYTDVTVGARKDDKTAFSSGSTIPIKFRIDQGALTVAIEPVGTGGGSVQTASGNAGVDIPAGALPTEEPITIQPVATPPDPEGRLLGGSAYEFGPDGLTFDAPVTITLKYDPAAVPAGVSERLLRLFTFANGEWVIVPESSVDIANNAVSGATTHFSLYAVLPAGFVSVTAGENHTCGLTEAGSAWCWGSNLFNQLGAVAPETCGTTSCATQAIEVQGGHSFTAIEAGTAHSCGLKANGEIWCWGGNTLGQLGDGTLTSSPSPVKVPTALQFMALSAESSNTCGLTTTNDVYCWGRNTDLNLGSAAGMPCIIAPPPSTSVFTCSTTPVQVPIPPASDVDLGLLHGCARTLAGDVYCWGWNQHGQIGTGSASTSDSPPFKVAGTGYTAVSAGAIHNCALIGTTARCWGNNFNTGALGNGSATGISAPAPVVGGWAFASIDASNGNYIFTHSCGVTTAGGVVCWGANRDGALGVMLAPETCTIPGFPTFDCAKTPISMPSPHTFGKVRTGRGFTCGYVTGGDVYCWGLNVFGQLGVGNQTNSRTPVKVLTDD